MVVDFNTPLSLSLEFTILARLADQQALEIPVLTFPALGLQVNTTVLGILGGI